MKHPVDHDCCDRRAMLKRCATGFGGVAMAALLQDPVFAGISSLVKSTDRSPRTKDLARPSQPKKSSAPCAH